MRCSALTPGSRWPRTMATWSLSRPPAGRRRAAAARSHRTVRHGWPRSSEAGASGPIGPSRAACSASAFSAPVTMSRSSRAASSVRSPTVSASRGTRSAPPKSAAAAAMVDGSSATRRTPSPGREPGSLKATCASRPGRGRRGRRGGVEHRLVARRLGLRVGGGAVERLAAADRDPGELAVEGGAEAARVVGAEAEVLVEAEHRDVLAGQRAVGGVVAQGGIQAARRVAGGQQHARACARGCGWRPARRRSARHGGRRRGRAATGTPCAQCRARGPAGGKPTDAPSGRH